MPRVGLALAALVAAVLPVATTGFAAKADTMMQVRPSAIDPGVKQFDDPSVVISPSGATAATPIAIFLPGTGGRPANAADLLGVIAGQGYRVIGLEYDDDPAVAQVCPKDPDPNCSAHFRQMRVFGDGPSKAVNNPVAEAISARLVALLTALDKQRPGEGWAGYLKGGQPDWSRFVVSGLSQGAGMAAYIAMKH